MADAVAYMRFFDKPNVPSRLRGNVEARGYEGWMNLRAVAFERLKLLSVLKDVDSVSPYLYNMVTGGEPVPIAVIHLFNKDGTLRDTFNLEKVLLLELYPRGNSTEQLKLGFEKMVANTLGKAPDVTFATRR